jgi:hypothetical protein
MLELTCVCCATQASSTAQVLLSDAGAPHIHAYGMCCENMN